MRPLIIGSYALAQHLERMKIPNNLKPKDIDMICIDEKHANEVIETLKHNAELSELIFDAKSKKFNTHTRAYRINGQIFEVTYPMSKNCTTYELVESSWTIRDSVNVGSIPCTIATINMLYSLKLSHRFLKNSPHFLKTMNTIRNLRSPAIGAIPHDPAWLQRRAKETYDYGHPMLNVRKDEFFTSNFDYIYDHDSIHEAVKLLERPAYTFYMDGDAEVNCSRDLFFKLDLTTQLLGVLEETYVLALERSQIPTNFKVDPKESFLIALEKVCTSITSGWFREFAWENYHIVVRMYDSSYVDKFKFALQSGKILPYKPA
ncbi:hypothetical protein HYP67_gp066 [Acinetobacter phage vB_ApiM_fHyAci03]|uniref:Uncharacterized protein n=1 Tax=Acinetobacter phage vB_ApiM_fHyAci03 TaxID=2269366 RepID=A0A345AUQ2_9CAUD|nr:hypothetical protein HYP67_gp066 [Acinetobacter phage vB_ApiM_fHyAci03]AXF40635.1 hypothetical protein Ac3_066 [Acinetobacter phage vB_ApiM_fHyAci03]